MACKAPKEGCFLKRQTESLMDWIKSEGNVALLFLRIPNKSFAGLLFIESSMLIILTFPIPTKPFINKETARDLQPVRLPGTTIPTEQTGHAHAVFA